MELNVFGAIFVFLVASYPGLIVSVLIFCVSVIVLISKRKKINHVIKIILAALAIISVFLIGISVYLGFVFGRPHSVGIIGGSDGPTLIYISGSKSSINSFAGYGYIVIENNTLYFDEVEIITRDDVERIAELGLIEQRDYPSGFYINHLNKEIVKYELTDNTVYDFVDMTLLFVKDEQNSHYSTTKKEEFIRYLNSTYDNYPPAQTVPFFIQVKDGKVISVTEEFRFTI